MDYSEEEERIPHVLPDIPPKLSGYDFFEKLKSPRYVVAPMVEHSELPFRMLCRHFGAQLAYTPMIHSRMFLDGTSKVRRNFFSTCEKDRPLFGHFCGNDPETILHAAQIIEGEVDAVDLNLGCPQKIAKKGHYGSFLIDDWDLIFKIVSLLHRTLTVPVTCKIRIYEDEKKSVEYAKMLEGAGCQILTVHGRTRDQKGIFAGEANWGIIRKIKNEVSIPVIANGGIRKFEDIASCEAVSCCDAVMVGEALLWNPAFFSGKVLGCIDVAKKYMEFFRKYPVEPRLIKSHLFKLLGNVLRSHEDLRSTMATKCQSVESYEEIVEKLSLQYEDCPPVQPFRDRAAELKRYEQSQNEIKEKERKEKHREENN